jgi:hypothetical protein
MVGEGALGPAYRYINLSLDRPRSIKLQDPYKDYSMVASPVSIYGAEASVSETLKVPAPPLEKEYGRSGPRQ